MYWIASNKSITDMQACAASAAPCRSEREFVGRLRVSGILHNGESELYFGVPKSQAELARLLDKGFAALTPNEVAAIRQRGLFVRIDVGLRWREVLRWAIPSAWPCLPC